MPHPYTYPRWSYETRDSQTHYFDEQGIERCGENLGTVDNPVPCTYFPVVGNCRCNLHLNEGSRNTPTAYMSQFMPPSEQTALALAMNPLNRDISSDVALLEYRKAKLVASIFSKKELDFSALLDVHVNLGIALQDSDFVVAFRQWQEMDRILREEVDDNERWEEVYDLMERKRKLAHTESTVVASSAKVVTAEKMNIVLMRLLTVFMEVNAYQDAAYRRKYFEAGIRELVEML